MKPATLTGLIAAACFMMASPVLAQDRAAPTQLTLPATGEGATASGMIRGRATADYVFQARAGHRLQVSLKSSNASNYFNVLQDGKDDPLFIGSVNGTNAVLALRKNATYRIRVYLLRNAARRNEEARYELAVR